MCKIGNSSVISGFSVGVTACDRKILIKYITVTVDRFRRLINDLSSEIPYKLISLSMLKSDRSLVHFNGDSAVMKLVFYPSQQAF